MNAGNLLTISLVACALYALNESCAYLVGIVIGSAFRLFSS